MFRFQVRVILVRSVEFFWTKLTTYSGFLPTLELRVAGQVLFVFVAGIAA